MSLCTMGTSFGAVLTKMLQGANSIGNGAWAGVFIGIYREGLGPEPGESAWPMRRKLTVATLVLVPIVLLGVVRTPAV